MVANTNGLPIVDLPSLFKLHAITGLIESFEVLNDLLPACEFAIVAGRKAEDIAGVGTRCLAWTAGSDKSNHTRAASERTSELSYAFECFQ